MIRSGGIVLGKSRSKRQEKVYYIDDDFHALIIGATRSGKSRCLVLPSIGLIGLSGESMVLSDPKGELYQYTAPFLRDQGYDVYAIDFKDPERSDQYNFLDGITEAIAAGEIPKAINATWDLVAAIVPDNPKGERIWTDGEASIIASCILAVVYDNMRLPQYQNMTNVYYFISGMCKTVGKELPLNLYMQDLKMKNPNHPAIGLAGISEIAPSKTRGSFYTAALTTLKLFTNPLVDYITNGSSFKAKDIGRKPTAVFIILPDEKKTYYSLASLLVNQIYCALVELADQQGGRLPIRVNFLLDEFGNFTRIPSFDAMMTAAAGRGIRFNLFLQSFAQLEEKYERNMAQIIKGNCEYLLYLRSTDQQTLKEISERLGKYTTTAYSESASSNKYSHGNSSHSVNLIARSLMEADEIGKLQRPDTLVVSSKGPAMMYCPDLSQWSFNALFGMGDPDHNKALRIERQAVRPVHSVSDALELWNIWRGYQSRCLPPMPDPFAAAGGPPMW